MRIRALESRTRCDVLDAPAAHDVLALVGGLPEIHLVDPAGLFSTCSLKPKASNISVVRQAMPSALPHAKAGLGFCSTMQVLMSGNAASCAASLRPAGPQPTMSTSTSSGTAPASPQYPVAVACLRDLDELLTCFSYRFKAQRRAVRTTNAVERRFHEVRRRTRPMGTFQDKASMDRILFAVFSHENESRAVSTPFLLPQNN
jgi:Transposase, Mutator family